MKKFPPFSTIELFDENWNRSIFFNQGVMSVCSSHSMLIRNPRACYVICVLSHASESVISISSIQLSTSTIENSSWPWRYSESCTMQFLGAFVVTFVWIGGEHQTRILQRGSTVIFFFFFWTDVVLASQPTFLESTDLPRDDKKIVGGSLSAPGKIDFEDAWPANDPCLCTRGK